MTCFRQPFKLKGINNAFGCAYFMIHAMKRVCVSLSISIDEAPLTTGSYVHLVNFGCEVSRSPPLWKQFWIHAYFKHKLARRIEFAGDEYFLFPRFCKNGGCMC